MEKTVEMNNAEISDAVETLVSIINLISNKKISHAPDFSYIIGRNLRILRSENADYIDEQQRLIQEYGEYKETDDGKGYYSINKNDKDQFRAYQDKVKKLSQIKHQITIYKVPVGKMTEWNLPFEVETLLWFMVDETTLGLM